MNEEYIRKIYDNLGGESKFGSYDSYYKLITTDDAYIQKIHSAFGDDVLGSFDGFSTLVKKNGEPTDSVLEDGSSALRDTRRRDYQKVEEPSVAGDVFKTLGATVLGGPIGAAMVGSEAISSYGKEQEAYDRQQKDEEYTQELIQKEAVEGDVAKNMRRQAQSEQARRKYYEDNYESLKGQEREDAAQFLYGESAEMHDRKIADQDKAISYKDELVGPNEDPDYVPQDTREAGYQKRKETRNQRQNEPQSSVDLRISRNEKDAEYTQYLIEQQAPLLEDRQAEEAKKKGEEEKEEEKKDAQREKLRKSEAFNAVTDAITPSFIDQSEEEQAKIDLNKLLSPYGFSVKETGVGDALTISAYNQTEHTVDLQPFLESSNKTEAKALQDFVSANADIPFEGIFESEKAEDEFEQARRLQKSRNIGRDNGDGSFSSVLMASAEIDGKYVAVPTLFPKSEKYGSHPSYWEEYKDIGEAYDEAVRRGEVYVFDTEEEAQAFAEGGWKGVSNADYERKLFMDELGLNGELYAKSYSISRNAYDELDFVESAPLNRDELSISERLKYGEKYYHSNGKRRDDYLSFVPALEETIDSVEDILADNEYMVASQKWDQKAEGLRQEASAEAVAVSNEYKGYIDEINNLSVEAFGVPYNELTEENFKNVTQEQVNAANDINTAIKDANNAIEMAANVYEQSETFLNSKYDKALSAEIVENWAGVTNAWKTGYSRGKAGEEILKGALGLVDLDDDASAEEVAAAVVKYLDEADTGKTSGVLARFHSSRGFREGWNNYKNDPYELMISLAAESISQMLPYGWKIVGSTVATGTATGAAIGASGLNPITVGALALTGASWGLRTGMAATSFSMEYTNAVIDAISNQGYDITDPLQVKEALQKQEVWDEGLRIGGTRGAVIGAMDIIAGGVAGRLFKTGTVASKAAKVGAFVGERMVFDTAAEGAGELLAQIAAGQEIELKEITAEMLGAGGNQTSTGLVNMARDLKGQSNITIAEKLMTIEGIANERSSNERVSNWANRMQKLGQISADQNQRIQENVGLKRDAKEVLVPWMKDGKKRSKAAVYSDWLGTNKIVNERVMTLLAAEKELSSTPQRKAIFSEEIRKINEEVKQIALSKELPPVEQQVVIAGMGLEAVQDQSSPTDIREGVSKYQLKGKSVTREKFLEAVNKLSNEGLQKLKPKVENDDDAMASMNEKLGVTDEVVVDVTEEEVMSRMMEKNQEIRDSNVDVLDDQGNVIESKELKQAERKLDDEAFFNETKEELLKQKRDAIQEQSAEGVDVQEQTVVSEEVGEGDTQVTEVTEEVEAEEVQPVLDVVDKVTPSDRKAYNGGTIEDARKESLLAGVAKRLNDKTKLTKFQQTLLDENNEAVKQLQDRLIDEEAVRAEATDLESLLDNTQDQAPQLMVEEEQNEGSQEYRGYEYDTENKGELKDLKWKRDGENMVAELPNGEKAIIAPTGGKGYNVYVGKKGVVEYWENDLYTTQNNLRDAKFWVTYNNQPESKTKKKSDPQLMVGEEQKADGQVVYHVTLQENKKSLSKEGVKKDRMPTYFKGKEGLDLFETQGKTFAFSDLQQALDWGIKMKLDKGKEVSIVAINVDNKTLQEDKNLTNDPFIGDKLTSAVFIEDIINPNDVISIEDITYKQGKPFDKDGNPFTKESLKSEEQQNLAPNGKPSNLSPEQYKLVRTPAFKKWFGDWETDPENASKVLDENGEPMVQSHFTNAVFDVFKYKESGFHFGDPSIKEDLGIAKSTEFENEITVFLNIRNPLRVDDSHRFDPPILINQLVKNGIITQEQFDILDEEFYDIEEDLTEDESEDENALVTKQSDVLIKVLSELGYDGMVYENKFDSQDSKMSYLIDEALSVIYVRNSDGVFLGDIILESESNERAFLTFTSKSGEKYVFKSNEGIELKERDKKRIKQLLDDGDVINTVNSPKQHSDFDLFTGPQDFKDSFITFESNQSKLADGSNKTFDPNEPSIQLMVSEEQQKVRKLAQAMGMQFDGYFNPQTQESQIKKAFGRFGFGVRRARQGESGFGGRGVHLTRNGKMYNPFKTSNLMVGESQATQESTENYQAFVENISKAFPNVEVIATQEEFDSMVEGLEAQQLLTKGQVVYGAVVDGKLYLNPSLENYNTPVHEFGHVWLNVAKNLSPEAYEKGLELVENSEYVAEVENNPTYKAIIEKKRADGATDAEIRAYILEEALATAIGNKGESFVNEAKKKNFKSWLKDLFEYVKKLTGISGLSSEQIQNMTLDEFTEAVVVDLMSENEAFVNAESNALAEDLQLMTTPQDASISEVVKIGRESNFSDAAIRLVLKGRGFKTSEINEALKVNVIDLFTEMPREFESVTGGLVRAVKMFESVKKKLETFNKKKDKTKGELRAKAIELLEADPIFKQQSSDVKEQLIVGLSKTFDTRADVTVQQKINNIKNNIKQRKSGAKTLLDAQKKISKIIKDALPKSKYTTRELTQINNLIRKATAENLEAQIEKVQEIIEKKEGKIRKDEIKEAMNIAKNNLKQKKEGARNLRKMQVEMKNFIRRNLPKSSTYTQAQINKQLAIITKTTEENFDSQVLKVMEQVEKQRQKMKTAEIKTIKGIIAKASKKKSVGDSYGKAFFTQAKAVLKLVMDNDVDGMIALAQELSDDEAINKALLKDEADLTTSEREMLDKLAAFDTFSMLDDMSLEEVISLKEGLKDVKRESSARLKEKRKERAERMEAIKQEGREQIEEGFPDLYNEDGSVKNENDIAKGRKAFWENMEKEGFWKATREFLKDLGDFKGNPVRFVKDLFKSSILHTGTITNILDKAGDFFKKNIYESLNGMIERFNMGVRNQNERLDSIANSIEGITQGYSEIKKLLKGDGIKITGFTSRGVATDIVTIAETLEESLSNIRRKKAAGEIDATAEANAIATKEKAAMEQVIKRMRAKMKKKGVKKSEIKAHIEKMKAYESIQDLVEDQIEYSIDMFGEETTGPVELTREGALRVYSLSKNPEQRQRLYDMGLTDEGLQQIEEELGSELTQFADKVVDYLSNDYYESVNNVYKEINDVDLKKIDNYFPTKTLNDKSAPLSTEGQNFGDRFNVEYASALKNRVSKDASVDITVGFTQQLDSHFESMERYKAFAEGVKTISEIMKMDDVQVLLTETGYKSILQELMEDVVNPAFAPEDSKWLRGLLNKFYGIALGFKIIQLPKQATSFINAYSQYSLQPDSKIGFIGPDLVGFAYDTAKMLVMFRTNLRKARSMSATFDKRVEAAMRGDIAGLEGGIKDNKIRTGLGKWWRTAAASPTTMGDIMGVMGYMTVYNRNIKNGMSEAEAVKVFNDYNRTQQTRRGTELSKLQVSAKKYPLLRLVTMFSSTLFLQMNEAIQAAQNIARDPKAIKKKDVRSLYLNVAVANMLFVAMSNVMKFARGDKEDKEEVLKEIGQAAFGLNQIKKIPIIGSAIQGLQNHEEGTWWKDPNAGLIDKVVLDAYKDISDDDYAKALISATELAVGFNSEIFIGGDPTEEIGGLAGIATGNWDEEAMDEALGISKSYRPSK